MIAVDDVLPPIAPDGKLPPRDMPRVGYAGDFDPAQIPGAWEGMRKRADIVSYPNLGAPKAASFHPIRNRLFVITKAASQRAAEEEALKVCNDDNASKGLRGPCFVYAINNRVVLPLRLKEPLTPASN